MDHLPLVDEDEAALGALDVHRLLLVRQRHVLLQPELGLQLLAALVALELLLLQQTLLLPLVSFLVAEMLDMSCLSQSQIWSMDKRSFDMLAQFRVCLIYSKPGCRL